MKTKEHLDKNNLHHAYLIEGKREEILPDIFSFMETLDISTSGNPDFCEIQIDNFKIDEALNLRSMADEKSFTTGKKIFIVSAHRFSLDAEHALLKMFEEPIENTHFFMIVPDTNALLKTLVSRFYLIKSGNNLSGEVKEAEKFIKMSLGDRINFIKELLIEPEFEDEEGNEMVATDSTRAKASRFLNAVEVVLHRKVLENFSGFTLPGVPSGTYAVQNFPELCFEQIFKVREFLRQPGSSTKSLIESVALVIPYEARN